MDRWDRMGDVNGNRSNQIDSGDLFRWLLDCEIGC
jgi:hypothetical protein